MIEPRVRDGQRSCLVLSLQRRCFAFITLLIGRHFPHVKSCPTRHQRGDVVMSASIGGMAIEGEPGSSDPNLTCLSGAMLRASCVLRGRVCGVGLRGQDCVSGRPSAYQANDAVMSHLEASLTATDADCFCLCVCFCGGGALFCSFCSKVATRGPHRASGRRHEEIGDGGAETVLAAKAAAVVTWSENGRFIWLLAAQGALIATCEFPRVVLFYLAPRRFFLILPIHPPLLLCSLLLRHILSSRSAI